MNSVTQGYQDTRQVLAAAGIVGVSPDSELMYAFAQAWAVLPTRGFWVGGYDGGAYVWLQEPCPNAQGLCFGEVVGLQHRYRGRFVVYSEHPFTSLTPGMLDAADPIAGISFRRQAATWRLLPLDADSGFFRASADRQGEALLPTTECVTPGTLRVFEDTEVVCVIISRQDGQGLIAEIRTSTGELLEPADEYVSLRGATTDPAAELLVWHRGLRLLIARDGRMFQAD